MNAAPRVVHFALFAVLGACSSYNALPNGDAGAAPIDASTAPPADASSDAGRPSDGGTAPTGCTFDTRVIAPFNGKNYESLTTKGKYWIFDGDTLIESNDLTSVARYTANGPCTGKAPGTCRFDTLTFSSPLQGAPSVETVTAYGKYWRFDGNTPLPPIGGAPVESIVRYASGPCVGQPANGCRLDVSLFFDFQGSPHEVISVGNRYWIYQGNSVVVSAPLSFVPRFAAGPCAGHADDCTFENKIDALFNGKTYETIDAYGSYWIFDGDTLVETNRHESVARYAAPGGPCAP